MLLKKTDRFWKTDLETTDKIGENQNLRFFILSIIFVLMFAILFYRLWELQIVDGQKYAEELEQDGIKVVRDSNARGNIYDCNGEILAYNKLVYTVTMIDNGDYSSGRERQLTLNSMIYTVAGKLAENGEQLNHELKITAGADGNWAYTVTGKALERFKADIFGEANPDNMTEEQINMSANEMIQFLAANNKFGLYGEGNTLYSKEELQEYGLPKEYTKEDVLNIIGVRYMLSLNAYRKYVPVILARDVSEETVAYILENSVHLTGIHIGQDWERVYEGGEAFSHILGYVGKISAEELEEYEGSEKGYTAESIVGKTGVERYLENELQGIDGKRQIYVNYAGKVVGEGEIVQEVVNGRDVYLSIDKDLQIAIYHILEQNLAGIITSNLVNAREFDKSHIKDTTDIRIPVYDVYIALFENHIIQLEQLYDADATKLEQFIAKAWDKKYKEVIEALRNELLEGNTDYRNLSEEMQEYAAYIVNGSEVLDESLIDREDAVYIRWKNNGKISLKEFLVYAIESGWIREGVIDSKQGYFTTNEMYQLLTDTIEETLNNKSEFKNMLLKYLILEERISGMDICKLLYEQGILSVTDGDYENLSAGRIDAFSFIKKKIEKLEITPAQLALDPCSASAVVVQEETGKVLACVSYPGYDNNRLANQMDAKYYNQLLGDKSLPFYNRATQQLTAPGSTFKPVTIVAGLQEGVISVDTSVFCDGVFDKVTPKLRCWKHSGHGDVSNVQTALQFSCNDYLCEISYRLGMKNGASYDDTLALNYLQQYAMLFHLDEKSGIEIDESKPHVTNAYGIPSAIGQGTHNYTTVQLARYVNSIASEGKVFSLSLVKGAADENGVLAENETVQKDYIELPESVWNAVKTGMVQFAQDNAVLKDMEIWVAGKTGTAQESKRRPDHALFVGYAPAEEPEITVAVRIANGYSSSNATIVGRNIFNYYFGTDSQKEFLTGEADEALNIRTD